MGGGEAAGGWRGNEQCSRLRARWEMKEWLRASRCRSGWDGCVGLVSGVGLGLGWRIRRTGRQRRAQLYATGAAAGARRPSTSGSEGCCDGFVGFVTRGGGDWTASRGAEGLGKVVARADMSRHEQACASATQRAGNKQRRRYASGADGVRAGKLLQLAAGSQVPR